jgi:hypothetical protein
MRGISREDYLIAQKRSSFWGGSSKQESYSTIISLEQLELQKENIKILNQLQAEKTLSLSSLLRN